VSKLSLADQCYQKLKTLIVSCDIAPGSNLTEKEIIQRTGYGRTPVREALARLDIEGLVETRPRSGYSVTEVNTKTVTDLFDVWKVIGPLIVRRAFENDVEGLRNKLEALLEDMQEDVQEEQSIETLLSDIGQVFTILVNTTENRDLIFIHKRLSSEQYRIFSLYLNTETGRNWLLSNNKYWRNDVWVGGAEVAEAHMVLAIQSAYVEILKLIDQR